MLSNTLDKDLKLKQDGKYSKEREEEALQWIQEVIGRELVGESFHEQLKDGVALVEVANSVIPGTKLKPQVSRMGFKQMENIHSFLEAIKELGVRPFESFQTVDLYEEKNMVQVIDCIFAVSRCADKNGFQGPRLGPKMATANERNFSQEVLEAGKSAVPLMKGLTKYQTGISFGSKRQIGGVYAEGYGKSQDVELDTSNAKGFETFLGKSAAPAVETSMDEIKSPIQQSPILDLIDQHIQSLDDF